MKATKPAGLSLVLIASLTSVGACHTHGDKGGASRAPSSAAIVRPLATISGPVHNLITTKYQFTGKNQDASFHGAVDRASNSAQFSITSTSNAGDTTTDMIAVGTDLYVRMPFTPQFGFNDRDWTHLDGTKITSLAPLGIDDPHDPLGLKGLDKAIVTVEQTGDRTYRGTIDLSAIPTFAQSLSSADLSKFKSVPFEATLNGQGQLTKLAFTVRVTGDVTATDVNISDLTQAISKPTRVIEATKEYACLSAGGKDPFCGFK